MQDGKPTQTNKMLSIDNDNRRYLLITTHLILQITIALGRAAMGLFCRLNVGVLPEEHSSFNSRQSNMHERAACTKMFAPSLVNSLESLLWGILAATNLSRETLKFTVLAPYRASYRDPSVTSTSCCLDLFLRIPPIVHFQSHETVTLLFQFTAL